MLSRLALWTLMPEVHKLNPVAGSIYFIAGDSLYLSLSKKLVGPGLLGKGTPHKNNTQRHLLSSHFSAIWLVLHSQILSVREWMPLLVSSLCLRTSKTIHFLIQNYGTSSYCVWLQELRLQRYYCARSLIHKNEATIAELTARPI